MVPVDGSCCDIYQIKYFATALDDSRKAQIRGSLKRIRDNTSVTIRNWYLTLPLNPSNEERLWFDGVTAKVTFHCEWFGLDRVESLAAAHQDVLDYYLHDGRERLERSIADLRSLVGLKRPTGNQLVEPSDLTEPLTALYELLNRDDPHYRYEFEVGRVPPLSADDDRPYLVARVSHGNEERAVTVRIFARYRMATEDAPIPISFDVDEEDLAAGQIEAWQRSLRYGTPAEVIARNVVAGLPGGLGDVVEMASLRFGPALNPQAGPYRIRLGVLDPDGRLLADAIMEMEPATQGLMGGSRASGSEQGGSFEFESLVDPPETPEQRFALTLRPSNPSGKPPAALERGTRFLSVAHKPNRLAFGPEFGPLLSNPFDLPYEDPPINPAFFELIDALAVIQNNVKADLVVPELESLTTESLLQILRAAGLVRGETIRDTWNEEEIEYKSTFELPHPDAPAHQVAFQGNYSLSVGEQIVDIGQVVITWLAAHLEVRKAKGGKTLLTARPAMGNNTRLLRRGEIDQMPPIPVTPA